MPVTTVVITGAWLHPNSVVPLGYVEFTPMSDRATNGGKIVLKETVRALLDTTGSIDITLVRCADGYSVKEVIDGVSAASYVLADDAGPIDLSTV